MCWCIVIYCFITSEHNILTNLFLFLLALICRDKLRLKGFQTAANARGAGGGMLQGDQEYKNPVYGVSTGAPQALNQDPTINNIYEVVKELNGVGEVSIIEVYIEIFSGYMMCTSYEFYIHTLTFTPPPHFSEYEFYYV